MCKFKLNLIIRYFPDIKKLNFLIKNVKSIIIKLKTNSCAFSMRTCLFNLNFFTLVQIYLVITVTVSFVTVLTGQLNPEYLLIRFEISNSFSLPSYLQWIYNYNVNRLIIMAIRAKIY